MREIVYLLSTAGTGYFYTTTRNKRTSGEKLRIKKYDPKAKKHVDFVEDKKLLKGEKVARQARA